MMHVVPSRFGRSITLVVALAATAGVRAEDSPVKPKPLRPGDTIMFVAPAGEVNPEATERARKRLEEMGFHVRVPEDITRRRGYLAGDDARRANEFMAAFTDPEVDAVFPVSGGYGVTRILDRLDYDAIRRNPKMLIGFSDITGLHLAIAAKCNLVTFHSPNPEYGLGTKNGFPAFNAGYFWRNVLANPPESTGASPLAPYEPPPGAPPIAALRPGAARGRLIGGNLSLVAALMGTPYEIETDGRVVFLEDIREAPYRIDRMLSQLKLAGKLERPAAVVLGAYYRCEPSEVESSLSLDEVFHDYFGQADYPVLKDFPAGHGPRNATLPLGAMVEVTTEPPTLRLLEMPTSDE